MIVAIPSLGRENTISKHTLKFLQDNWFPQEIIYIFVADEKEKVLYEDTIDPLLYNDIIVGELGVSNQRNFIRRFFPEDTEILYLDDDIMGFKSLYEIENFYEFCLTQFEICRKLGISLWGVYPLANFLKDSESNNKLTFCIGSTFGIINSHDERYMVSADCKEDYELSFIHFSLNKKLRRVNWIGMKKSKSKKGGLFSFDRYNLNLNSVSLLKKKYPDYISKIYERNGYTEIRLPTNLTA